MTQNSIIQCKQSKKTRRRYESEDLKTILSQLEIFLTCKGKTNLITSSIFIRKNLSDNNKLSRHLKKFFLIYMIVQYFVEQTETNTQIETSLDNRQQSRPALNLIYHSIDDNRAKVRKSRQAQEIHVSDVSQIFKVSPTRLKFSSYPPQITTNLERSMRNSQDLRTRIKTSPPAYAYWPPPSSHQTNHVIIDTTKLTSTLQNDGSRRNAFATSNNFHLDGEENNIKDQVKIKSLLLSKARNLIPGPNNRGFAFGESKQQEIRIARFKPPTNIDLTNLNIRRKRKRENAQNNDDEDDFGDELDDSTSSRDTPSTRRSDQGEDSTNSLTNEEFDNGVRNRTGNDQLISDVDDEDDRVASGSHKILNDDNVEEESVEKRRFFASPVYPPGDLDILYSDALLVYVKDFNHFIK